ncbi:unnamed protein product, partial [marine sediment metagenome]
RADQGYAATRAVIWNLAKLMIVKDVFYVSYLLTRYEKLKRDRQKYQVNMAGGDKIRYKRTFHPRILGYRLDIKLPHFTTRIMARLKFIRVLSQVSRQKERAFLGWYLGLVEGFARDGDLSYEQEVEILDSPAEVRGYAELREERMTQAREKVESITLASRKKAIA